MVSNELGDTALLLTFPYDEIGLGRENKVWHYTWDHERYPENPDDPKMLTEVAATIKKLVDRLKSKPPDDY